VFGNVPAGETWSGYPARPHKEALKAQAAVFRLPRLMRTLERIVRERDTASGKTHDDGATEREPERESTP
jgi:UDP-3-O-[3-hydroxymyristoyl] glucosamine N-acyltransferase